jgi:hypothetical protein
MSPPSMSTTIYFEAPFVAKVGILFECIKSFSKYTSYKGYVLRAQHLLDVLCGEGSAIARDLLHVVTSMVNKSLGEKYQMSLTKFVVSEPLTLLLRSCNIPRIKN